MKTHKQKYVTLFEQNSVNKASITQKLIKNKTENTELNEQAEIEKDIYTDMEEKIDAINAMESTLKEGIVKLKNKTLNLQREVNELQSQYHIENSRLLSIRNMTERYEGFGQSIKRVMEQKDNNPGIIGVVADVIKTPEKYEMAIETALGGQIQNIVTDTQSIAREMIGFLKRLAMVEQHSYLWIISLLVSQIFQIQPLKRWVLLELHLLLLRLIVSLIILWSICLAEF